MIFTADIPLSEQEQQSLQMIAQQTGATQGVLLHKAVQMLIEQFQKPYLPLVAQKKQAASKLPTQRARERFERHFGALKLDIAMSIDNDDIDADLAQAYAATHEEA